MTDPEPIVVLAESIDRLVGRLDTQHETLTVAVAALDATRDAVDAQTAALRRHRRRGRPAVTSLAVTSPLGIVWLGSWAAGRGDRDVTECLRDNATREATVRGMEIAVVTSLEEATGDHAEALRVGAAARRAVAQDPALQPRDC